MGRACGMYVREEKCLQCFGKKTEVNRRFCVDERIMLKWILIAWEVMEWFHLAQDMDFCAHDTESLDFLKSWEIFI
jgi:hypothetical protein